MISEKLHRVNPALTFQLNTTLALRAIGNLVRGQGLETKYNWSIKKYL